RPVFAPASTRRPHSARQIASARPWCAFLERAVGSRFTFGNRAAQKASAAALSRVVPARMAFFQVWGRTLSYGIARALNAPSHKPLPRPNLYMLTTPWPGRAPTDSMTARAIGWALSRAIIRERSYSRLLPDQAGRTGVGYNWTDPSGQRKARPPSRPGSMPST